MARLSYLCYVGNLIVMDCFQDTGPPSAILDGFACRDWQAASNFDFAVSTSRQFFWMVSVSHFWPLSWAMAYRNGRSLVQRSVLAAFQTWVALSITGLLRYTAAQVADFRPFPFRTASSYPNIGYCLLWTFDCLVLRIFTAGTETA